MEANRIKQCDNNSVGVLIHDDTNRLLVFERQTPPIGVAPPAGHVDEHGTPSDTARAEVREEVGLTVVDLAPIIAGQWVDNRCRRRVGPRGPRHCWWIFSATTEGELQLDPREAAQPRWLDRAQLVELANVTTAYANGELSHEAWKRCPGLEPVWVYWLDLMGFIEIPQADVMSCLRLATIAPTTDSAHA